LPARLPDELRIRIDARMRKAGRFGSAAQTAFDGKDYETCASRCYYAAFHAATALLMAHGRTEAEQWQTHDMVMNQCITLGTRRNKWLVALRLKGARDFANSFHGLYNRRLKADYGSEPIGRRRANEALVFVTDFLIAVNDRIPLPNP